MEDESAVCRVARLESELNEARSCLEDTESNLLQAADFGKRLLDTNQDLSNRLEELTKEYTEKIEALEQEKYSLQLKLECQGATLASMTQDLDSVRSQLEQESALRVQRLEEMHSKKLHQLAKHNDDLKADIDKLDVQLRTAQERARRQEETVEQLKTELASASSSSSSSPSLQHELTDLQQLYSQEKARSKALELAVLEAEGGLEVAGVEKAALEQRVLSLEEECTERCAIANKWYQALKEANDQNAELSSELDTARLELMGDAAQRGGNSLFGEVEDRRLDVERRLISLQVQHEGLEKTHTTTRQQLKKMKAEMSALLCQYGATTADAAHVQRLQRALQQSRSESQVLLSKLHKLERQQADVVSAQERQKCMAAFVDFGNKKEYIQFLEQELEQARREHAAVQREVDMVRSQLLWETNKLSEAEGRLHLSEQEQAKVKKELTKLKLRLQETTEKYQQATTQCKQLQGDNKLLEEQVKSRGRKAATQKRTQPGIRRSAIDETAKSGTHEPNSSLQQHTTMPIADSSQQPVNERDTSQKSPPSVQDSSKPACASKDINILEELDREFDRQKSAASGLLGTSAAFTLKGDLSMMTENAADNSSKGEGAGPSHQPPVKVVRVGKGSVNECPQQ